MHGSSTTSVRVKYSPSANTRSSRGKSVVFTFLISELSLVAADGTEFMDSLDRASLSSSWGNRPGSVPESGLAPPSASAFWFCCCSFSFCLRILSSLWTLTGSASLCSSARMEAGSCRCCGFLRCSWTAEGMPISHSLVHLLTWELEWKYFFVFILCSLSN